jgi:hypothetical protein
MSDLVKSLMGGGWSLVIGWILPVFLSLQLITLLILPEVHDSAAIERFLQQPASSRQITLLAIAAVVGLVLAAAQAPLYRVLEGYALWPSKIADIRIDNHKARKKKLVAKYNSIADTDRGVRAGLMYERASRYPSAERQFAPTSLGNAIRRFETYAGDRYQLDSQLLWHNLIAVAPPQAVSAVDKARASVDFFICLLYGGAATALLGFVVCISGNVDARSVAAIGIGILISISCYRLAVLATDEWDAAVRAVVDHGRTGLAAAFGLAIPDNLADERYMWRVVNTLVRREFIYSESKDIAVKLQRFKAPSPNGPRSVTAPRNGTPRSIGSAKSLAKRRTRKG